MAGRVLGYLSSLGDLAKVPFDSLAKLIAKHSNNVTKGLDNAIPTGEVTDNLVKQQTQTIMASLKKQIANEFAKIKPTDLLGERKFLNALSPSSLYTMLSDLGIKTKDQIRKLPGGSRILSSNKLILTSDDFVQKFSDIKYVKALRPDDVTEDFLKKFDMNKLPIENQILLKIKSGAIDGLSSNELIKGIKNLDPSDIKKLEDGLSEGYKQSLKAAEDLKGRIDILSPEDIVDRLKKGELNVEQLSDTQLKKLTDFDRINILKNKVVDNPENLLLTKIDAEYIANDNVAKNLAKSYNVDPTKLVKAAQDSNIKTVTKKLTTIAEETTDDLAEEIVNNIDQTAKLAIKNVNDNKAILTTIGKNGKEENIVSLVGNGFEPNAINKADPKLFKKFNDFAKNTGLDKLPGWASKNPGYTTMFLAAVIIVPWGVTAALDEFKKKNGKKLKVLKCTKGPTEGQYFINFTPSIKFIPGDSVTFNNINFKIKKCYFDDDDNPISYSNEADCTYTLNGFSVIPISAIGTQILVSLPEELLELPDKKGIFADEGELIFKTDKTNLIIENVIGKPADATAQVAARTGQAAGQAAGTLGKAVGDVAAGGIGGVLQGLGIGTGSNTFSVGKWFLIICGILVYLIFLGIVIRIISKN